MSFGVYTVNVAPYQVPASNGQNPVRIHYFSCTDSLATIQSAGYLNNNLNAEQISQINPQDAFDVSYSGGFVRLYPSISGGIVTLSIIASGLAWVDVVAGEAALASAGKVNVQVAPSTTAQYIPRDLRVNYSSAGLSGSSGNRLLALTDGTTVWNNAGITAALLGTPVNTLWGGSGNPVPGNVAMNTASVAGANIYFQYAGGTTDYSAGSVSLSVLLQRVA